MNGGLRFLELTRLSNGQVDRAPLLPNSMPVKILASVTKISSEFFNSRAVSFHAESPIAGRGVSRHRGTQAQMLHKLKILGGLGCRDLDGSGTGGARSLEQGLKILSAVPKDISEPRMKTCSTMQLLQLKCTSRNQSSSNVVRRMRPPEDYSAELRDVVPLRLPCSDWLADVMPLTSSLLFEACLAFDEITVPTLFKRQSVHQEWVDK